MMSLQEQKSWFELQLSLYQQSEAEKRLEIATEKERRNDPTAMKGLLIDLAFYLEQIDQVKRRISTLEYRIEKGE